MAIEQQSNGVTVAHPTDDPSFADDISALQQPTPPGNLVINFAGVTYLNSANLASLLQLRKHIHAGDRRMILCGIRPRVWDLFKATGLDKIFDVSVDVEQAVASF